ncbi:hypothetical protein F7725_017537 [Dissostichus mawsoni]|uniref:Uncharacterized protein n=1 Tax=Dissostichus mawsoni TaxID=36200 RepID=A0A7J5Z4S7_DISMA|nr:hypothetical protein F7725_017537 [Dissostichus mawsoni]
MQVDLTCIAEQLSATFNVDAGQCGGKVRLHCGSLSPAHSVSRPDPRPLVKESSLRRAFRQKVSYKDAQTKAGHGILEQAFEVALCLKCLVDICTPAATKLNAMQPHLVDIVSVCNVDQMT